MIQSPEELLSSGLLILSPTSGLFATRRETTPPRFVFLLAGTRKIGLATPANIRAASLYRENAAAQIFAAAGW